MLVLELGVLVFLSFNLGKEMLKKKALAREVASLEQELGQLEKDKDDLSDLLSYVQTDSFVEFEARNKLNLAKEGESVIVIPQADKPSEPAGAVGGAYEDNGVRPNPGRETNNAVRWWQYFFSPNNLWLD